MSVVPFSLSKFDSYYMTEYDISSDVYQEYQKGAVAFWFLVSLSNLAVLLSISRVLLRPKKTWPQLIALLFLLVTSSWFFSNPDKKRSNTDLRWIQECERGLQEPKDSFQSDADVLHHKGFLPPSTCT